MWSPSKIEIYNLFAHKESVYDFKNNTCTVIFGKNETDRGLENNGAGKTTLFEATETAEAIEISESDSVLSYDKKTITKDFLKFCTDNDIKGNKFKYGFDLIKQMRYVESK